MLVRQARALVCKACVSRCVPLSGAALRASAVSVRSFSSQSKHPVYENGQHRSNAEELVDGVPVITVPATVAVCDGGSGALGHPVEYIQLDTASNAPQACKYCGLRYKMGKIEYH